MSEQTTPLQDQQGHVWQEPGKGQTRCVNCGAYRHLGSGITSCPDRRPAGFTDYVCGFMVGPLGEFVLLVRKNRPEWQRGRLNGIGGKIEPGEAPAAAMAREFKEEAGVETTAADWLHRVTLTFERGRVFFFLLRVNTAPDIPQRPQTDELVYWCAVHDLPNSVVPNLRWLVPLCTDDDLRFPIEIHDVSDAETNGATVRERQKTGA